MDAVVEFGFTSSGAKTNRLIKLFTTFVGEDMKDLLSDPEPLNIYNYYMKMYTHDRKYKLKNATSILLKSIDNVNHTDDNGRTFLHHFLEIFFNVSSNLTYTDRLSIGLDIIENLLDNGASIHIMDNKGFSPLKIVMSNQQAQIMRLILIKLKNICVCYVKNCQDKQSTDTSPLHIHAGDYSVWILEICLENGVDFIVHAGTNETALIAVCKYSLAKQDESKKANVVSLLTKQGCNINAMDSNGYSALHYAIEKQNVKLVSALIELGADPNRPTNDQRTPFFLALQTRNLEKIDVLVKAGANVDAEIINENVSPLIFTMLNGYSLHEIVSCLIENGADLNCWSEIFGFKPLHLAVVIFESELVDLIAKKGSDVDARTKCGLTALHLASLTSKLAVVDTLIKHGSNVNCRQPSYGLTPLHLLSMRSEMFHKLNDRVSDTTASLLRATLDTASNCEARLNSMITESLIKNGANVNVRDSRGMTPLHYAATESPRILEEYDVLPTLLRLGAHVNQQANDGQYPLLNVLQVYNTAALRYLIHFGADLSDIPPQFLDKSSFKSIYYIANEHLLHFAPKAREEVYHYLTKLHVARLFAVDFSSSHKTDNDRQMYRNLCKEYSDEVAKLKRYFIEDRISLYDWLRWNHTRARPFYLTGIPFELQSEFPIYYEVIQARYRMVVERMPLLEPAKLAWYQITKIDLPEICVERILFHLNNRCLRLLADNFESKEL